MPAPVTYEGVGGGGVLFEGLKFWVAIRVPSRQHWVDLIKSNGGDVVPLEKNADLLIADHARKDCPPGSYSWRFIEQSVKNGVLENPQDHPAATTNQGSSKIAGIRTSQPNKSTRTAFTPEDDRILMSWVVRAERSGRYVKGNAIYDELAAANPRHTPQSWRSRWISHVQHLARPATTSPEGQQLPPPAATDVVQGDRDNFSRNTHYASSVSEPRRLPRRKLLTHTVRVHDKEIPTREATESYTIEDYNLLKDAYDDLINLDEARIVEAWTAWAELNPQHTAAQWQTYWANDVYPVLKIRKEKDHGEVKGKETVLGNSSQRYHDDEASATRSVNTPRRSAQLVLDEHPSSRSVADNLKFRLPRKTPDSASRFAKSKSNIHPDSPIIEDEEREFREKLKNYSEYKGNIFNFYPIICDRPVSLYRLWELVNRSDFGGFKMIDKKDRWLHIATKMHFNSYQTPEAKDQLRELYRAKLSRFHRRLSKFRANMSEGNSSLIDSASSESESQDDDDDNLDVPSSTPRKRHSMTPQSPENNKRQKTNKGALKEIPSTPDHFSELGSAGRMSNTQFDGNTWSEIGSQTSSSTSRSDVLIIRGNSRLAREPETQDFSYPDLPILPSPQMRLAPEMQTKSSAAADNGSNHTVDSSTQSQTNSQRAQFELQQFIDLHISLGTPEAVVAEALQATTLETGDAAVVMESLSSGQGIPGTMEGVWSAEDDAHLKGSAKGQKGAAYKQIVRKHGLERCKKRLDFLRTVQALTPVEGDGEFDTFDNDQA